MDAVILILQNRSQMPAGWMSCDVKLAFRQTVPHTIVAYFKESHDNIAASHN